MDDEEDAFCNMVAGQFDDSSGSEEAKMAQDSGRTEMDDKRKDPGFRGYVSASGSEWEQVAPPMPSGSSAVYAQFGPELPTKVSRPRAKAEKETVQMIVKVDRANIEDVRVTSLADVKPARLDELRLRELQCDCDRWNIRGTEQTSEALPGRSRADGPCHDDQGLCRGPRANIEKEPAKHFGSKPPQTTDLRSGSFRSYSSAVPERPICPRTGIEIPPGLEIGEPVAGLTCAACHVPMLLRRRRDGAAYFFGCQNFSAARSCKYRLEVDEGLALVQRGPKRQP